ncbi:hypothetical protein EZI54_05970 [Marinobacter halodurans]|uniref:SsuA/THI5-like domain-containing protein n=1 Tax=Marinobacter halodurans TaxID=2528979 RepID=A0ABY1ZPK1_9GAMM|nr:ABC transporter substrate-binding protein [Marinobacter halodurans]TBW57590.1 hypothetical protein EZI54_05970 [Marinobacter halodurans]
MKGKASSRLITFLAVVLFGTAALFYGVDWNASSSQEPADQAAPLRISTYYWPGMFWIDIARTKGWFEEAGLNAELVDYNDDYYASLDDLRAGGIDAADLWLFDLVRLNQQGANLVLVLAADESNGSEGIASREGITAVEQLEGQRIGVPLGTALVYELDVILARFGVSLEDVTLVDVAAEKAAEVLSQDRADAVMTWEPYLSEAGRVGRRLYDSSKLPGLMAAGITFRKSFVDSRPQDIQKMVEVWHRATRFIKDHPE